MDDVRPIPGVMLDDVYRVLGDRAPEESSLLVERIEPGAGITYVHYRLADAGGEPLADATGADVRLVGGVDAAPPGLRPGDQLRIPDRGSVGTPL